MSNHLGADEVDSNLNAIKGGGACLFQEKLVASAAKKFIIVADEGKISLKLGERWKRGVPCEVSPLAYALVLKRVNELGGTSNRLIDRKWDSSHVRTWKGWPCRY